MPRAPKAGQPPRWPIIQSKFCPKTPLRTLGGKKTVKMTVSCFITAF